MVNSTRMEMAAKPLRTWLAWLLRAGFTIVLLGFALRRVPLREIKFALLQVDGPRAALSAAVFLIGSLALESARLAFAARLVDEPRLRSMEWLRVFAESRPFFYVLPAAVAAEGMVWTRLRQYGWRHASCGFVVLNTRIWGVAAWGLTCAYALRFPVGTAAILAQAPPWMRSPAPWTLGALLAMSVAAAAPALMGRFNGLAARDRLFLPTLAMALTSAASVLVVGYSVFLASAAARTPIPFHGALGLMALFNFAMVLPIAFGGFGLQEALVLLLGMVYGYPPASLVAFATVIHLQRLVLSFVGLGFFLTGRQTPAGACDVDPGCRTRDEAGPDGLGADGTQIA